MTGDARALPIVVVGGGISGLAAAYHLVQGGAEVRLFEANARLGGNIATVDHDGFLYDLGPDSFLRGKPAALQLCEELGLASELICPRPEGARVFVARADRLLPMPEGLALGVPVRAWALLTTELLTPLGKLRAMLEPVVPVRRAAGEESILTFLTRRLGAEMAERIAAPLLAGVFAGDAARLSMEAAFPQLVGFERRSGSLLAGIRARERGAGAPSAFVSLRRGLGQLVSALAGALPDGVVRLGQSIRRVIVPVAGESAGVELDDGSRLAASHVIVAGPPWTAASLLSAADGALAEALGEVRGAPTGTVFFGLRRSQVKSALDGSGFIVPPGEGRILAATWISSKWEGRAPADCALIRAFVGGARGGSELAGTDAEVVSLARQELERFMGSLGAPLFTRVHRYDRGTPQPDLGHLARMGRIQARLADLSWLSVIGSGYQGVGIPDCARQAREVVASLLKGDANSGVV